MPNKNPIDIVNTITRWAIMLFLAYIFWQSSSFGTSKPKTLEPVAPQIAAQGDCNSSFSFPIMSVPLFPSYVPAVRMEDVVNGTGVAVVCGEKVKVKYEYADTNNKVFATDEKTVAVGEGKLLKGLELGLIGMKAGGQRKITVPAELAYYSDTAFMLPAEIKGKAVNVNVTLNEIITKVPESTFPLRAMNNKIGKGLHVQCGDRVNAAITLWKLDGTKFYSSDDAPVSFVYGQSRMPYGIEQAVVNLMVGGENTVIIPPAYAKPLVIDSSNLNILPVALPENEIIIARVSVIAINPEITIDKK